MEQDILQLSMDLIRIPSITGDAKQNLRLLNLAKSFLGSKNKPIVFKKNGVVSYLWSNAKEPMKPNILLFGHLDVVDAESPSELFRPKLKKGRLLGRGAGDMKGHAAVLLACYKQVLETNTDVSLALLLTTDEEVGGFNGARYVVESGLKPGILFLPDSSVNFDIVVSEKAPHHFTIEAKGEGGHASRAFEIDNPLNKILGFYEEVRREFHIATRKKSWASTFEIVAIATNNRSLNKVPSLATASFSWRWPLEHIKFEVGRRKILKIATKHSCKVVSEEGWGEGVMINKSASYVNKWKKIIEQNSGKKVSFTKVHGSSDARHFFNNGLYGTKNIIVTSAVTGGHHSQSEWVDVESLAILGKSLLQFINEQKLSQ